jgi:hypothetical protein
MFKTMKEATFTVCTLLCVCVFRTFLGVELLEAGNHTKSNTVFTVYNLESDDQSDIEELPHFNTNSWRRFFFFPEAL